MQLKTNNEPINNHKKMKKYLILLTSLLAMLVISCSKDKGNYNLVPINEIKITGTVPDLINIYQFETLKIEPVLEQSKKLDENKLIYSWTTFLVANPDKGYVLGNSKNLNARIEVKPGKYFILYTVKDPETGVSFFKQYRMDVGTKLSEGWMALVDQPNGKQEISMVNTAEEIMHNLYENANSGKSLPENTYAIKALNGYNGQLLFMLAKADAVELDYIGMKQFGEFKSWFYTPPATINPQNYFFTNSGTTGFIINDNEIYSTTYTSGGSTLFGSPVRGDWKLSPFTFPSFFSDNILVYDTKNQRFLKFASAAIAPLGNPSGSAFDPNKVGKQLIFGAPGWDEKYNCLLKNNNDDQYFIYRVDANYGAPIIAAEQYKVDDAPELNQAKLFTSSGQLPHLYYAVGNKIYILDIPAGKARLAYTFPVGTEITAIELKQSYSVFYPDDSRELVAATYVAGQGSLYKFAIGNTGDFTNNTYAKVYTGFSRIKDLEFKNASFY